MSDAEGDLGLGLEAVFTEPRRPPSPEPTLTTFMRERKVAGSWSTIDIRLVGSHPLWGHCLWNASRAFASYLDDHPELYRDRNVLELGAGGGLPGLVAAKNGAKKVVLTDYPDSALVNNIWYNVRGSIAEPDRERIDVQGYVWGYPVEPLLKVLSGEQNEKAFDLIIMSDLIFNHSQHDAMLKTCDLALSKAKSAEVIGNEDGNSSRPAPCLLVFYTHHRPHLAERDMAFFSKARERGWHCEEILTRKYTPMFPEDPGEEEVRATVHGWRLTRT